MVRRLCTTLASVFLFHNLFAAYVGNVSVHKYVTAALFKQITIMRPSPLKSKSLLKEK